VSVSSLVVGKALPGLKIVGELEGDAGLVMGGGKLSQLANSPRLEGAFRMQDGTINGMDLAETARSGRRRLAGGATHFDALSSTLLVDSSGQHLKQIKIAAGAMSMNGSADVTADGKLTGQLLVDLNKVRAGMGTLPLALTGTVAEPVWSIGH